MAGHRETKMQSECGVNLLSFVETKQTYPPTLPKASPLQVLLPQNYPEQNLTQLFYPILIMYGLTI